MTHLKRLLRIRYAFLATLFFIINSCTESDQPSATGKVEILFGAPSKGNPGGRVAAVEPHSLIISVEDANGNLVLDRKEVILYKFGEEFLSEALSFIVGDYELTEFLVVDESGTTIYATPMEGSTLAYLVEDPLPISFSIEKDETSQIKPQVITVNESTPEEFGYTTLTFNIIETFSFGIGVMAYDAVDHNFELTTAEYAVYDENSALLDTGSLEAITSTLILADGHGEYRLVVSKSGYDTYAYTFSPDSLKSYSSVQSLVVTLNPTAFNGAISLDGIDDYIDLGNIYDDVNLPVTISAWVFIQDPTPSCVLFVSQDNAPITNGFTFGTSDYQVSIGYGDGGGENHHSYRRGFGGATSSFAGEWTYITGVMRGSATDMSVYVNGVNIGGAPEGSSTNPMNSNFPSDVAKIGHYYANGVTLHFKGMVDELKIWNRALTDEEIADNRTKKLTGTEPGLIGYWSFDEEDGNVVYDKSSNHFDGTMINSPTRVTSGLPPLND